MRFAREIGEPFAMDYGFHETAHQAGGGDGLARGPLPLRPALALAQRRPRRRDRRVISNHPITRDQVEAVGLPFHHISVEPATKTEAERQILELIDGVDLLVLARYMQILSEDFLGGLGAPAINIHHSFLPAFVGADPYHRAYERGVKLIGPPPTTSPPSSTPARSSPRTSSRSTTATRSPTWSGSAATSSAWSSPAR